MRSYSHGPPSKFHDERDILFGDEVVAAAMIDRLVHHAEILSLKGDSCRLKDKDVSTRARPALVEEG